MRGATLLGTGTLASGSASITTAGGTLPVGTLTISVKYVGDSTFAASSTTVTQVVQ
jgi:hypothetical protein